MCAYDMKNMVYVSCQKPNKFVYVYVFINIGLPSIIFCNVNADDGRCGPANVGGVCYEYFCIG